MIIERFHTAISLFTREKRSGFYPANQSNLKIFK